ncbi:MAG: hypothetical protein AVDCRST_MAG53-3224, partial [uncultured Solirubrobacteraceae bacterium]
AALHRSLAAGAPRPPAHLPPVPRPRRPRGAGACARARLLRRDRGGL